MSLRIIEWPRLLQDSVSAGGNNSEKSAMTIGVFDGVHLGHQELIKRIVRGGPNPTVVTFRANPKKIVFPESHEGDIFSLEQKLAVFERLGVDRVILIDFSRDFSKLKGREFLDILGSRGGMAFLVIGSNFRCGYRKDTDADAVREINKEKGISTEVVPPVKTGGSSVSSSRIRSAIISGDMALAAALMGRNVEMDFTERENQWSADPQGLVCDLGFHHRIVPAEGRYTVLIHPGAVRTDITVKDGKIFLPEEQAQRPIESLEFTSFPI